ncbi:MAG: DUF5668 domain-containing protein [Candidatus Aminicenantes bacterium]|nr:DUF5668 domain-containing protein [Candidatus Aminicenantes bacterium]
MSRKKYRSNLIWGIILVCLGLVFLLDNFGYDVIEHIWKFWPVILIIWGWSKLRTAFKTRSLPEIIKQEKSNHSESNQ